jgi:hypothetical protein
MDGVKINLEFHDDGYGIKRFEQTLELEELLHIYFHIHFASDNADDAVRVNKIANEIWEWVSEHTESIREEMARELVKSLEDMRAAGEKYVPDDGFDAIYAQLDNIKLIEIYDFDPIVFELSYFVHFNDALYIAYITYKLDDFSLDDAGILTKGGFKAPKKTVPASNLKKAATLLSWHLDKGYSSYRDLYEAYINLPAKEIETFIDLTIADDMSAEEHEEQFLYLALFSYACGPTLPDKLYRYLIDEEMFYPGEIYLRADQKFAKELMDALATVDDENAYILVVNHILCALSAMPSKEVSDYLIGNSTTPLPIWARKLHILPKDYSYVFGFEPADNEQGYRRLFDESVTPFERCEKTEASKSAPMISLEDNCGFCRMPLTLIYDWEYKLATCMHCSNYQTIFVRDDGDGVHWYEGNAQGAFFAKNPEYMKSNDEFSKLFDYGLKESGEVRAATYTANEFAAISRSQIGGMPTAINNIHYPKCPECGKTMRFVGQFDAADVIKYGEGLYYFFVCEDCGITAANYGQS